MGSERAECTLCVAALHIIISLIHTVVASSGDRSWTYSKCLQDCQLSNCSSEENVSRIPIHLAVFGWECDSECKYICMWKTVDDFQKDGSGIPQFYGKWPFIRLFVIQEPASAFFSLLNGIANFIMICHFHHKVPSSSPLYYIWHVYALVAMNAWFWSVIFHVKDTSFTEMMDYFSAILLVLYSLFALFARLDVRRKHRWLSSTVAAVLISYFIYHVHYLAFVKFDYGYNMKANVTVGVINALGWLLWAKQVWREQNYVWRAIVSIVAVMLLLLLELGDFPPLFWILDAHALWHAGTAPLPFLWYRFLIDDCTYMMKAGKWSTLSENKIKKAKDV